MSTALDRLIGGLRRLWRGSPTAPRRAPAPSPGTVSRPPGQPAYPGDATRVPDTTYSPRPDGRADPGEIVWTWVPYEEDHTQGKDRPVLIIGREGSWLIALPLTSKDHDLDQRQEHRAGRDWVDIGSGPWDRRGRPSEVRVNRLVRIHPRSVRREGAVLPRNRYDEVIAGVRSHPRR